MKLQQHHHSRSERRRSAGLPAALLVLLAGPSLAEPGQDATATPGEGPEGIELPRPSYDLFHPTPREFLRELSADRPDKTESAYTVDAGHFQVEMDAVNFVYDKDGGTKTRAWNAVPVNLKLGVTDRVDLQLFFDGYLHVVTEEHGMPKKTQSGMGDISTRVKVNLWGNNGGRTALAVMPFVRFPASTDDLGSEAVEGGLIFPLAADLGSGWSLGAMLEVDFLREEDGDGRHTAFVNTITVGHDIIGRLAGYVEFFSEVSTERDTEWAGTVGIGFTYAVNEDLQLDGGINIGVNRAAEDFKPFLGLTWRY